MRGDEFIFEQMERPEVVGAAFLRIDHSKNRTTYYRLVYQRGTVRLWADEELATLWCDLPIPVGSPPHKPDESFIPTPLESWASLKRAASLAPTCGALNVLDGTSFLGPKNA